MEHVQPQPRALGPRAFVRNATVAIVSAAVVAFLVFYAVAAPTARLNADVGPVVPRPGTTAVVQGRVIEPDGGGLKGAQVVVRGVGRRPQAGTSNSAGAFQVELSGKCALYDISIRARALGSTVTSHTRKQLCPGDALPVDVRVVTQGHFLWIPGPR
jgi:hypothetical protein